MKLGAGGAILLIAAIGAAALPSSAHAADNSVTFARGSGNGLTLTVKNNGTTPINAITVFLARRGFTTSAVSPPPCVAISEDPDVEAGAGCGDPLFGGLNVPPGATYSVNFTTSPRYPDGAGARGLITQDSSATEFKVKGPAGPGGGGGSGGGDGGISQLTIAPNAFKPLGSGPSLILSPNPSLISFASAVAGPVKITAERRTKGRRKKGKCVKPTRKNRRARRCTRYARVPGSATLPATAGGNFIGFSGRLGGKALKRGRYRLVLSRGGGSSRVAFRIR